MPDIVISEFMDAAALADLAADYEVVYDPELVDRPADLEALLPEARALIVRNRTRVDGALLDAAPRLKVVGRLGVGLDNIDLEACARRGVAVCPATGAGSVSVAEYVIATMLALLRGGAYGCKAAMIAGRWPRTALVGREAAGRRLGLIGFGAIAREVAKRAAALEMVVLAHDPYVAPDDEAWRLAESLDLPELLSAVDVVSLHLPLLAETRNLVDAAALAHLKPEAIVINAARGGILDEEALIAALRAGRLAGAALDVFATEPLGADAAARFADVPNLILTPHIAGITQESNARTGALTAAQVRAHLEGRA